jgi:cysteinyl-tRNA synthetase
MRAVAEQHRAEFESAVLRRDVDRCISAVLSLEDAIVEWSRDSLQSDDMAVARRVLRSLVVRLGELAVVGARDPRAAVAPYVDLLVELRAIARAHKDFRTSDLVRDRLGAAGVELRDTGDGPAWDLT